MSLFTIPVNNDVFFTETVNLDGVDYALRFTYNERESAFHLSIQNTVTGNDIVSGLKLVTGWLLLSQYKGIGGLPAGEMVLLSNTNDDSPAGLDANGNSDLGPNGRVTLYYLDAAETKALGIA